MGDEAIFPRLSMLRWVLLGWWVMMFAVTHWPEIDEFAPSLGRIPHFDKLVHFGMFGAWSMLFLLALAAGRRRLQQSDALLALLIGAVYAAFDEITQGLVDRQPDLVDFTVDMLGITAGLFVYRLLPIRRLVLAP